MKRYLKCLIRTMLAGVVVTLLTFTTSTQADAVNLTVDGGSTYTQSTSAINYYNEYVGNQGAGSFTQLGGTNSLTNRLILGNTSTGNGSYNLSGTGILSAYTEIIGYSGNGVFTQTSGSNTLVYRLLVGNYPSSAKGSYRLSGSGTLSASLEDIGSYGTGVFTQTGGTNTVANRLILGNTPTGNGSYSLSNGVLVAGTEDIGYQGTGTFKQTGGTNTVFHLLTIAKIHGSTGTYNLSGGTLNVHNASGTATITNNDIFNYSGGTLNADTFNNNANLNISGFGTRTVSGYVTNLATGTVKTTNTTAIFTDLFINHGAFISDIASNYFTDFAIGPTGYIVGGTSDNFYISGNFSNSSTQNTLWQTTSAYLGFTGTGTHSLSLIGLDLGVNMIGYTNNFAWGMMELASGNSLTLLDGNSAAGGGLYLSEILGLTLSGTTITNVTSINGLNIYYDASLGNNAYLLGLNYSLTGGGQLMAMGIYTGATAVVPEPSTFLLLGSSIVGLGIVRRRFSA